MKVSISLTIYVLVLSSVNAFGQNYNGMIVDEATSFPLSYVNIGVIGNNIGTVSDTSGHYEISLSTANDADTLRFSIIGYESRDIRVSEFKQLNAGERNIYLAPKTIVLEEIIITSGRSKTIVLGNKPKSRLVNAGFIYNKLGHEIGSLISPELPGTLLLDSVQLNIARCNYEKVYFRLNVYRITGENKENILREPIYISLTKKEALSNPVIDLAKYQLEVDSDFIVSIEIVKDLGKMGLYFFANLEGKGYPTVYKETSQSNWGFVRHKEKLVGISILTFAH